MLRLLPLLIGCCLWGAPEVHAQPSANDILTGEIVKIEPEWGLITLRHPPIAHLSLPRGTTLFRYVEPRIIVGRIEGDRVWFKADRVDLSLRVTFMVLNPTAK